MYNAPPQRDFQTKEITTQTYLDMLPGHTLDPDIEVSFQIQTIGKGRASDYISDGYLEEDKEIPIYMGDDVDFRRTSFPIMSAIYKNTIRFENQRNEILSHDESSGILLPYLVPAMELANSYSIVSNSSPDDMFDENFQLVDIEKYNEERNDIVYYDPRGFDGRVVLRLESAQGVVGYTALPSVGYKDASDVEHHTIYKVNTYDSDPEIPFIPLKYDPEFRAYLIDKSGFIL